MNELSQLRSQMNGVSLLRSQMNELSQLRSQMNELSQLRFSPPYEKFQQCEPQNAPPNVIPYFLGHFLAFVDRNPVRIFGHEDALRGEPGHNLWDLESQGLQLGICGVERKEWGG